MTLTEAERATLARWAEGGGGAALTDQVCAIASRLIEADPIAGPLLRATRERVAGLSADATNAATLGRW